MTLSWLPGADRSQTFATSGTMTDTTHYKGLLHTMESMGWPGYNGGGEAPHVGVQPIRDVGIRFRQHLPFTAFAKALVNAPGGVETNRDGALQFELMGTCDERHKDDPAWYFWPEADDAVLLDLYRKIIHPVSVAFNISETAPTFLAYKRGQVGGSYGATSVRFAGAKWDNYRGWCGHQHVPENWHGDPGLFPWDRMMALAAKAGLTRPAQPGPSRDTVRPPLVQPAPTTGLNVKTIDLRNANKALVKGAGVKPLQRLLGVTADGLAGKSTRAALGNAQKRCGETVDYIFGPATAEALLAGK